MTYLLFVLYLILCSWAITRIYLYRNSGLPARYIRGYFWLKVLAGMAYGYFHSLTRKGGDTWLYHRDGLAETQLLRTDPLRFVTSIFQNNYQDHPGSFLGVHNSWWNDLDANTIPKLSGLCNLLTGGNYYTNIILINFLFLLGPLLLYKVWRAAAPGIRGFWQYLPFLLPSFLFWTSGLHKEGFLVLALGCITHATYFGMALRQLSFGRMLQLALGFLIILVLRNFLLFPVGAALVAWVAAASSGYRPLRVFGFILGTVALLFFTLRYLTPALDFPQVLADRQALFLTKKGESRIEVTPLEPTFISFLKHAPKAMATAAFRPLPSDVHNTSAALAASENLLLLFLWVLALAGCFRRTNKAPFFLYCFFLSLMVLLIIGYTIPFLGASVRYRSIVLPLLLMSFIPAVLNILRPPVEPASAILPEQTHKH